MLQTGIFGQPIKTEITRLQSLIQETGATIYEGFVHSIEARLHRGNGRREQAERAWALAHSRFTACGAAGRAEQVAREMTAFTRDGPDSNTG